MEDQKQQLPLIHFPKKSAPLSTSVINMPSQLREKKILVGDSSESWFGQSLLEMKTGIAPALKETQMAANELNWQEAAKKGDIAALKRLLADGQDINALLAGKTALQWAITEKKLEAMQFLLAQGARVDILTAEGTALTTAIHTKDAKIWTALIQTSSGQAALVVVNVDHEMAKKGTSSYDKSEACYTPFTYLLSTLDEYHEGSEQKLIGNWLCESLKKRPDFWPQASNLQSLSTSLLIDSKSSVSSAFTVHTSASSPVLSAELEAVYRFYILHYDRMRPEYNRSLLCYAIARITAQNLGEILANIPSDRAPAMLISALMNLDAKQDKQPLPEGWQHEAFLTLRIGSLIALRLRLMLNVETVPESLLPMTLSELLLHLDQGILCELEMLRTAQEIASLPLVRGKPIPLTENCYQIIAQRLAEKIMALPDKEEYVFATGWQGHAVYLSWMRQGDYIIWRVDNLNPGEKNLHPQQAATSDQPLYLRPKLVGRCHVGEFKKSEYINYLKELVAAFRCKPMYGDGVALLYHIPLTLGLNPMLDSDPLYSELPFRPIQAEGNCYAKSHEPGFYIRTHWRQNSVLLDYLLTKEKQFALEGISHQPLNLIHSYQMEVQQQLPDYMLEHIRNYYHQQSRVRRLFSDTDESYPISDCYINLSVVKIDNVIKETEEETKETKEKKVQESKRSVSEVKEKKYKGHQFERDTILASGVIDIHQAQKENITPEKLWEQIPPEQPCKQVIVVGPAGIGKSTFCQFVAHQWAVQKLWPRVKQLFWLHLRELKRYANQTTGTLALIDMVATHCLPHSIHLTPTQRQVIQRHIDQGKVLWLLDGYDEIAETAYAHPNRPLARLLDSFWQQPQLLLTSRPQAVTDLQHRLSTAVLLEITGFTDDNIAAFINRFFLQTPEKGEALENLLKKQVSVQGLAHVPINLELLCRIWLTQGIQTDDLSLTQLYQKLTEGLLQRDLHKQGGGQILPADDCVERFYAQEQRVLAELALATLTEQQVIITDELLISVLTPCEPTKEKAQRLRQRILRLGILRSNHSLMGERLEYYFLHLTFQEYYAARAIAVAYSQNEDSDSHQAILDLTAQEKYNPRYQIVWWFVSGILATEYPTCLNRFFNQLLREPREIIPSTEWGLWLRCFDEAGVPDDKQWTHSSAVLAGLQHWIQWNIAHTANHIGYEDPIPQNFFHPLLNASPRITCHPVVVEGILIQAQKSKNTSKYHKQALEFLRDHSPNNADLQRKLLVWLFQLIDDKDYHFDAYRANGSFTYRYPRESCRNLNPRAER